MIAVLAYHAEITWVTGGFLGVELFFVVSGFLITSLLVGEVEADGRVDLWQFWLRRARRLLPALGLVLVAGTIAGRALAPEDVAATRGGLLGALGGVANWQLVFGDVSYFEAIGRPPLFQHLWSLAVEMQYYLLWPLAVVTLARRWGRWGIGVGSLLGAAASASLMWLLVEPSTVSRVYYGTDTRAAGLLVGGALAVLAEPVRRALAAGGRALLVRLDRIGVASLAAIVALMIGTSEYDLGTYRGGLTRFALLSAVVILVATLPGTVTARVLEARWLVAIGVRSYGLYLWHWPIFMLTRPHLDIAVSGPWLLGLRLALTAAATELSLRLLEQPLRRGELRRRLREWAAVAARRPFLATSTRFASLVVVGLVAYSLAVGPGASGLGGGLGSGLDELVALPVEAAVTSTVGSRPAAPFGGSALAPAAGLEVRPGDEPGGDGSVELALGIAAAAEVVGVEGGVSSFAGTSEALRSAIEGEGAASVASRAGDGVLVEPAPVPVPVVAAPEPAPQPPDPGGPGSLQAVGDSVLLAASSSLVATFGGAIRIDGAVGRQPWDGVPIIEAWAASHPGERLLVVLGSNGVLRHSDVDRIATVAGPERIVVFVTVSVPRRWGPESNDAIRSRAPAHPNARVVDWEAMAAQNPGYLGTDLIHPSPEGARALSAAIQVALG